VKSGTAALWPRSTASLTLTRRRFSAAVVGVAAGSPPDLFYISQRFTAELFLANMTIDVDTEL
jgi:hypothetical protein